MTLTGQSRGRQSFHLDARYELEDGEILLTGVQALVRVLFDQLRADRRIGLRTAAFVSGYQGSPLGGFDMALQRSGRLLDELDVHWVPGVNEELGATAVWGSQQDHLAPLTKHDGVIGMWYCKSPGLDRSGDALRHANTHGVGHNGGVLCAVGDDPQAKSSTLPNSSELALYDLAMPVYTPGSPQEILDLGRHAYELSRYSGLWTSMKIVTAVADSLASAVVHPDRIRTMKPALAFDGVTWEHHQRPRFFIPDTIEMESELLNRRLVAAEAFLNKNPVDAVEIDPRLPKLTIVSSGRTYREVRDALESLGLTDDKAVQEAGIRVVRVALAYPLAPSTVAAAAERTPEIVVIEEKRSFIETQFREQLYDVQERPRVSGKREGTGKALIPCDGELTADRLRPILYRLLVDRLSDTVGLRAPRQRIALSTPAPARVATFCSGCPHNTSTVETSGSPVGGGVGCHALVMWLDRGAISYTQMGGEGAHWIGRAPFTDIPHFVQNVGDGTFFHSASLVVRQAVSAGANMTFKLLYNGVVAMTGGQDPAGLMDLPALTAMLSAEGVTKVEVVSDDPDRLSGVRWPTNTTLRPRHQLASAEAELASTKGVTVLVFDQACANELRRLRKRGRAPVRSSRVIINELVCEGCGDCGAKSNCLSVQPVETELGRKTQIHQTSCNTDYSCLDGDCPSFVTVKAKDSQPSTESRPSFDRAPEVTERPTVGPEGFGILLAGVGGTGVVTVNQVLATAAFLEGFHVTGLDQTGLAQKGGPVVSHLRLSNHPTSTSTSVNEAQADTLLALDPLVAVDPRHFGRADRQRTTTITAAAIVPTGEMVRNVSAEVPDPQLIFEELSRVTRPGRLYSLDIVGLAETIFGDSLSANVVALGAAYQVGAIPMSEVSIEEAIEINGVAVERNIGAFRAGRLAMVSPDALPKVKRAGAIERHQSPRATSSAQILAQKRGLHKDLAVRRAAELIEYQDQALAERYLDLVALVEKVPVEGAVAPLSEGVIEGFFHLLAYKDEYEVARLHLLPEARQALAEAIPGGRKLRYRLHPPLLRSMGMKRKMALPGWVAQPAFLTLRSMRKLRGTRFDPFGNTKVRKLERRLASQYEADMKLALSQVTPANAQVVVELARLPLMVKGYEELKVSSAERYESAKEQLLERLRAVWG